MYFSLDPTGMLPVLSSACQKVCVSFPPPTTFLTPASLPAHNCAEPPPTLSAPAQYLQAMRTESQILRVTKEQFSPNHISNFN